MRAAYDTQVRRSTAPDGSGALIEAGPQLVRWLTVGGLGWSGITWSDLGPGDADATIAAQVALFRDRGERLEWKLYDYDQPPDLAGRLIAAGFVAEEAEALMAAEVSAVAAGPVLPAGVRLVPVTDEAGVDRLTGVHERVFGVDHSQLRRSLNEQLRNAPSMTAMVVAMAGDEAVCSARIEFIPGRDFASLWGGGTLPDWRGKGIYRALVAHRARLAAARGYRYLQVDASPQSEPILARLGFTRLAGTTPYIWEPATPA